MGPWGWWAEPGPVGFHAGASWLMGGQATSADNLEGKLQNAAYQHQCPFGRRNSPKWLLPASISLGGVMVAFCLSGRLKVIKQVGLTQALFKLLPLRPLHWEILHEPFKSKSVSYSPPALPYVSLAYFQSQTFWVLLFLVQDPCAGERDVRLGPLTLWGKPLQLSPLLLPIFISLVLKNLSC